MYNCENINTNSIIGYKQGAHMISLMQILSLLNKKQLEKLKIFFDGASEEISESSNAFDCAMDNTNMLLDFLFNHFGLELDMSKTQKIRIAECMIKKTYISAFNIALLKECDHGGASSLFINGEKE